jgi:hypothetical protein
MQNDRADKPSEFAAERLALRTPAEIATDIIPDRPLICKFPVIKHYFIFREWLETGISPSCTCRENVDRADSRSVNTQSREIAGGTVRQDT